MRKIAFGLILKGFITFLVSDIQKELSFSSQKECLIFLNEQNAIIMKNQNLITKKIELSIDCKESSVMSNCSVYVPSYISSSLSSISHTTSISTSLSCGLISKHSQINNNKNDGKKDKKDKKDRKNGSRNIIISATTSITTSSIPNGAKKTDRGNISGVNQSTETSNKRKAKASGSERKNNKKRSR